MADKGIEVKIPHANGIPKGSLISIRLGNTRRQALFGSDRPYRFQGPHASRELMKVDVYMPIAEGQLLVDTLQPQAVYFPKLNLASALARDPKVCASLDGAELLGSDMSIELDMHTGEGAKVQDTSLDVSIDAEQHKASEKTPWSTKESSAKRHQVAIEAQPYFEQHEVLDVLRHLLQVMIKERPEDPYGYMIEVLQNSRKGKTTNGARQRPKSAAPGGRQAPSSQPTRKEPSGTAQSEAACKDVEEIKALPHPEQPSKEQAAPSPAAEEEIALQEPGGSVRQVARWPTAQNPDIGTDPSIPPSPAEEPAPEQSAEKAEQVAPPPPEQSNTDEPAPPPEQLLPLLPDESSAKPATREDELKAIQAKVRGCLTQKVQAGALEKILSQCGFGLIRDGNSEKNGLAKGSDISAETLKMPDGIAALRDKLRHKIIEKHELGEFDSILKGLVFDEAQEAALQKAAEPVRLQLQNALLEKFEAGEMSTVFQTITGPPPGLTPRSEPTTIVSQSQLEKLTPAEERPREEKLTPAEEKARQDIQEFKERLRDSLTASIIDGSIESTLRDAMNKSKEGAASSSNDRASSSNAAPATGLVVEGKSVLDQYLQAKSTKRARAEPAGKADRSAVSTAKAGAVVEARYVGPAGAASSSASAPLGKVVGVHPQPAKGSTVSSTDQARSASKPGTSETTRDAGRAEEVGALQQHDKQRQGSWCSEVGRLNEKTSALDDRTASLERMVRELMMENIRLREDFMKRADA